ncbi:DUF924 family protein [Pseudoroseomonas globiformis]|uniref:DUF924 family protein n=1 Tax=Teichococcus globiformis TaxID=2307229 RepID=A0ABV7G2Z7_9PROT
MTPADIISFWFADGLDQWRSAWFVRSESFDQEIADRFSAGLDPAGRGEFDDWANEPDGALALCILLDQFPRNLFRGTAKAFTFDQKAREIASLAISAKLDQSLPPTARVFLYLPFEHSESLADQDRSVALFETLREHPPHGEPGGSVDYAWRHHDVIRRFGRFPHRNIVLGRHNTAEEEAYLAGPGAGF